MFIYEDIKNKTIEEIASLDTPYPTPHLIPVNISVFGLGYVGSVTSVCFANLGHRVIGVDNNPQKVSFMNKGIPPIFEEGVTESLTLAIKRNTFSATTNAIEAVLNSDISLVSVCTPSREDGSCNTDYLKDVASIIGVALREKSSYHLVLFRSTIPPGTTEEILIPEIERTSGKKCGPDFGVCFNPEFLRESTAIKDFTDPPKTVIGASDEYASRVAKRLYKGVNGEIFTCSIKAAEFVKYVDNSWHALKVSFGNEIGRLCKASGVDSHEVMNIFCQDKKLNISSKYLLPGTAFGGSCLPKDVRSIQHMGEKMNLELPILNNIIHSNNAHICHIVDQITSKNVKKIGILGLTFKSGTDDMRESPIFPIIEQLKYMDYEIAVFDDHLMKSTISQGYGSSILRDIPSMKVDKIEDLCQNSDMLLVSHKYQKHDKILKDFASSKPIIDLVRLQEDCRTQENYHGVCW